VRLVPRADPRWSVHQLALGSADATATIHVASDTSFSSLAGALCRFADRFVRLDEGGSADPVTVFSRRSSRAPPKCGARPAGSAHVAIDCPQSRAVAAPCGAEALVAASFPTDTTLVAVLWLTAAAGLLSALRLEWWYWPGSVFLRPKSGIWTALAWNAAHGEIYRAPLSADGYGGSRYMPLLFAIHALVIRAHVDPVVGGALLMHATVAAASLALFAALGVAGVPRRFAVPLSLFVWCTVIYQQSCTDLNPDYLAAAIALVGVVLAAGRTRGRLRLAGAAACVVLAALTKITAIAFAAPVLFCVRRQRGAAAAALSGAAIAALFVTAAACVDRVSGGRFVASVAPTLFGGAAAHDVLNSVPKLAIELAIKPFDVALPFALALATSAIAAARRRFAWPHAYLITACAVTLVIFASPGTASNHLVDLQMASVLTVGAALAGLEPASRAQGPSTRSPAGSVPPIDPGAVAPQPPHASPARIDTTRTAVLLVAAAQGLMLGVIAWPAPGMPSVIATIAPRPRAAVRALGAEFLPPGTRYVATDPIVAVLNGDRPRLLDYFNLDRFYRDGTPAGRDFAARVHARFFDVIVLPDSGDFPTDLDAGALELQERGLRYWAGQDSVLAPLIRSTYEIHAVRKPFVILTPIRRQSDDEPDAAIAWH